MTTRTEQARAALADVLPGWVEWPDIVDGAATDSPKTGDMTAILREYEVHSGTVEIMWQAKILHHNRTIGYYTAPINFNPRNVLRCAIGEARQTLEIALSTLPEVTP